MKRFDMKCSVRKSHKARTENKSLKESEKALARADDDGFALPEKKEAKNNHEK